MIINQTKINNQLQLEKKLINLNFKNLNLIRISNCWKSFSSYVKEVIKLLIW